MEKCLLKCFSHKKTSYLRVFKEYHLPDLYLLVQTQHNSVRATICRVLLRSSFVELQKVSVSWVWIFRSEHGNLVRTIVHALVPCPEVFCKFYQNLSPRCFPVDFVKFLRRPFFIEPLWWLPLKKKKKKKKFLQNTRKISLRNSLLAKLKISSLEYYWKMDYFRVILQRFSKIWVKTIFWDT